MGTKYDAIQPNYFPEEIEDVFDEQCAGEYDSDKYLHMLVWTLKGGKLRLVEMTGCGLMLLIAGMMKAFIRWQISVLFYAFI